MRAAGERAGERDVPGVRGGLGPAEVDHEAQVVVCVGARGAPAAGRRHVVRRELALPLGVLGGHRRHRAGAGQIRYGRGVTAGEHLGVARHSQVLVDDQSPLFGGQPHRGDQRVGPYAHAPGQGAAGDELAVVEQHPLRRGFLDGRSGADLHAAGAQHPFGGARQPLVELGQRPVGDVQQQPAGPRAVPRSAVVPRQGFGEPHAVGGDFGAGVARADDHERGPGGPLRRVLAGTGQFHLADHVVAQIQRFGHAAEAVGVLGDARDGQQLVDAADGQHQPVVRQGALPVLGVGVAHPAGVEVHVVGLPEDEPDARQGAGERHRDPARLQDSGRHFGQQRHIEKVVMGVDQHDLGGPPGLPGERAGTVVTGETGSDDHDPRATSYHVDSCGRGVLAVGVFSLVRGGPGGLGAALRERRRRAVPAPTPRAHGWRPHPRPRGPRVPLGGPVTHPTGHPQLRGRWRMRTCVVGHRAPR